MNKRVRVLHAITRLDRGGSSENTLLSAIGLSQKGYDVDILFGQTENPSIHLLEKARKSGVSFIEEDDLVRNIHPVRDTIAFLDIYRYIRDNDYDIVHTHSSKAGFICRFAAKLAGVKTIIYTPHGHVFYGYFSKIFTRLIIFAESLVSRVTDKIVGLTPAECDEWIGFGIGKEDQYTSIPSGIDFDEIKSEMAEARDIKDELWMPQGNILVGSVGRFVDVKGYDYFIKAAVEQIKKRNNIYFILAGDGPLRKKYKKMITAAGVDEKFRVIGWQESTSAVIKSLDIFVLPSLNEGMGRVLVEAMFFEKPVIATRVGGVSSVISGGSGLLVEPASAKAIDRAIDMILNDPDYAREMARKGHERALAKYSA
ncbi:MAG: glycosyltransferase, partial [Candidatus Omnitrophota bacterium]